MSSLDVFLQQGAYLRNWTPATVRAYRQSIPADLVPTRTGLDAWVRTLWARNLTPGGINLRIRAVNSFLSWLLAEGLIPSPLKVRLLPVPRRTKVLLEPAAIRALLQSPHTRTRTLVLLLLDTGLRIHEALGLEWAQVSLDDCWLLVRGKGGHERPVPFSPHMRATLYRWSRTSGDSRVFGRLNYRNAYRDIRQLWQRCGVTRPVHPHLFRHQFASTLGVDYVRAGHSALSPLSPTRSTHR